MTKNSSSVQTMFHSGRTLLVLSIVLLLGDKNSAFRHFRRHSLIGIARNLGYDLLPISPKYKLLSSPGRQVLHTTSDTGDVDDTSGIIGDSNQYEMSPFDAYPSSVSDDEILDIMREQNQVSNDLWQSTYLRDHQAGEWIGSFEIMAPVHLCENEEYSLSLRLGATGAMTSVLSSGIYTKDQEKANGGVEINCHEEITEIKASDTFKENEVMQMFLRPVRNVTNPKDFRLPRGNQAIGGSYTLAHPMVNNTQHGIENYYTEIAIRDGSLRVRCKYLYTCYNEDGMGTRNNSSLYEFTGLMLIREHLQGTSPVELKPLLTDNRGFSIYDPQHFGASGYREFTFPGQITCFFPEKMEYGMRGTLCVQWQGGGLRYQTDRKFESLVGNGIRTFEVTEIAEENAGINYYG